MSNLFSFEVSESVLDELGKVSQRYMKERLEKTTPSWILSRLLTG